MKREYSTGQVAELADVHKRSLYRWLELGLLPEPKRVKLPGGVTSRVWSEEDLQRVKDYAATLPKIQKRRARS
jgi:DNA-binding transcriptional MerR regulator